MSDFETWLDRTADTIVSAGLATPAILVLEMHRPITGVLHSAVLVLQPLLFAIFGNANSKYIAGVVEDQRALNLLIERIEVRQRAKTNNAHEASPATVQGEN